MTWSIYRGDGYTWDVMPTAEAYLYVGQETYPTRAAAITALLAEMLATRRALSDAIKRARAALSAGEIKPEEQKT